MYRRAIWIRFFSGADQIRELYGYDRENFTYSVIEGAMGLYDGLGGTQKEGSAYHLAQTLDLPVVLVLDARGMGRHDGGTSGRDITV